MPSALHELSSRLDELMADAEFIWSSVKLRPRLATVLNWEADQEVVKLARVYMDKRARVEGLNAALLVRAMAAFERFLRSLVEEGVSGLSASKYEDLPLSLRDRHFVLTGRVLAGYGTEKDFQQFNYEAMVSNLASCKTGSSDFRLNARAFSLGVVGGGPDHVERALKAVDVENWWDSVGASSSIQAILGARRTRDTAERARQKLKELSRWRNNVAHGGDEEVALSEEAFREVIEFLRAFAACLDSLVCRPKKKAR